MIKKVCFLILVNLILLASIVNAATRTWMNNATTGLAWNSAANWVEGSYPASGDDVVISPAADITIINVPSVSLRSFTINPIAAATLTLQANSSVSITITGTTGNNFYIATNSGGLNLGNYVSLVLNSGVPATINQGCALIIGGVSYMAGLNNKGSIMNNGAIIVNASNSNFYNYGTINIGISGNIDNASKSFTVYSGGVINNSGRFNNTATVVFQSGSLYNHTGDGGSMPAATTWNSGCECRITGVLNLMPSNIVQNYAGKFTWNCPNQSSNLCLGLNKSLSWGGFNIISTGNAALSLASATSYNLSVNTGNGGFNISDGILDLSGIASDSTSVINLNDNFSQTGGQLKCSNTTKAATFNLIGTGLTINAIGAVANPFNNINWDIISGDRTLNSNFFLGSSSTFSVSTTLKIAGEYILGADGNGSFILKETNCNLFINSRYGITAVGTGVNAGNIQCNRAFIACNYTYSGSTLQYTGDGLPANVNTLTVNNSGAYQLVLSKPCSVINTSAAALILSKGKLVTSDTSLLTIKNTATTAITVTSGSYIIGPLKWMMPVTALTNATYLFPVSYGMSNYTPISLTALNTSAGSGSPYIQVKEVYNSAPLYNAVGLKSLSNHYWLFSVGQTLNISSVKIQIADASVSSSNIIAQSQDNLIYFPVKNSALVAGTSVTSATSLDPNLNYITLATIGGDISGTYAIGKSRVFQHLYQVANALSVGVIQPNSKVYFELYPDYDGTVGEVFPIVFNQLLNNAIIEIRPNISVTSMLTTSGDPGTGLSLISLNGVSNFIFDGRAGGIGSDRNQSKWTIMNTRTTTKIGSTIELINDAFTDTLRFLNIKGAAATTGVVNLTAGKILGNTYCSFEFNKISNIPSFYPYYGIFGVGLRVWNNEIYNYSGYAVFVSDAANLEISYNHFYNNTGLTNKGTVGGIFIDYSSNNAAAEINITNNYIGGSDINCGGAKWLDYTGFTAMYLRPSGIDKNLYIRNNVITNITLNNVGSTSNFIGINLLSSGQNAVISNNTIGSTDSQTSILSQTSGYMVGIWSEADYNTTVSDNNIINIRSNYTTSTSVTAQVIGIYLLNGINKVIRNNIHDISTNSSLDYISNQIKAAAIGIADLSADSVQVIGNNHIYNIYSTFNASGSHALQLFGIFVSGNCTRFAIENNLIHNIAISSAATSATAEIYGMMVSQGTPNDNAKSVIKNNMISLGYNNTAQSITSDVIIYGIYTNKAHKFYFNTVNIAGTVNSGTDNTYAFYSSATSDVLKCENNIFSNTRKGGTGIHYPYYVTLYNGFISDYNVYSTATNNNSEGFSLATLRNEVFKNDLHSPLANPGFINASGDPTKLNLRLQGTTPAEGGGIYIPDINTDIDSNLRSSLSPVDIGASAANNTFIDKCPPFTYFTEISKSFPSDSIILSNVTIYDSISGIPLSGTNIPRIWYRKNKDKWFNKAGKLTSGDTYFSKWSFNLDFTVAGFGGKNTDKDTISYYIVAQDKATVPNVWCKPGIGALHSNVSTQTIASTNPAFFLTESPSTEKVYYIGTGKQFTSLTNNDGFGFFDFLNTHIVTTDITAYITSDLNETGSVALNKIDF